MRVRIVPALAVFLIGAPAFAGHMGMGGGGNKNDKHHHSSAKTLIEFGTMYGVDGPFIGETNAIRGVPGDELPWRIAKFARGRLDTKGHLVIHVKGLVFTDDPEVPPELRGKNDEEAFRGLVSCLTEDGDAVVERNVVTAGFPASTDGNSLIKATIELPNPCVAPIVMVLAGSENKWFAVNGFESEEDEE